MRNLKRILLGVFILMLVMVILAFVLENQQSVSLLFLGLSGPRIPVSLVVVLALLAVPLWDLVAVHSANGRSGRDHKYRRAPTCTGRFG